MVVGRCAELQNAKTAKWPLLFPPRPAVRSRPAMVTERPLRAAPARARAPRGGGGAPAPFQSASYYYMYQ